MKKIIKKLAVGMLCGTFISFATPITNVIAYAQSQNDGGYDYWTEMVWQMLPADMVNKAKELERKN